MEWRSMIIAVLEQEYYIHRPSSFFKCERMVMITHYQMEVFPKRTNRRGEAFFDLRGESSSFLTSSRLWRNSQAYSASTYLVLLWHCFFSQSEKGQCIKIDPLKTFFRFCHKKAVSAFRKAENRDSLLWFKRKKDFFVRGKCSYFSFSKLLLKDGRFSSSKQTDVSIFPISVCLFTCLASCFPAGDLTFWDLVVLRGDTAVSCPLRLNHRDAWSLSWKK